MKAKRLFQTFRLWTIRGSRARAEYAKKAGIYAFVGEKVRIMDRKVPLHSKLIGFHNNIMVASNVMFITHDVIHGVLAFDSKERGDNFVYPEHLGCIEVMDNVFIGSGTTILGGVRIGPNAIVAAGSLVNKDVPPNSIVAGVPAKVIGNYEDLYKSRLEANYPRELGPKNQSISKELSDYMWEQFKLKREKQF